MLKSTDIREWIASLGISEDDNVYIGKLDNKQQKSVGVYNRSSAGPPNIALGGLYCTSYEVRPVSLLVHWNRSKPESESAAYELFEKLKNVSRLDIGDTHIHYIRLMVPEPQYVGTDYNVFTGQHHVGMTLSICIIN